MNLDNLISTTISNLWYNYAPSSGRGVIYVNNDSAAGGNNASGQAGLDSLFTFSSPTDFATENANGLALTADGGAGGVGTGTINGGNQGSPGGTGGAGGNVSMTVSANNVLVSGSSGVAVYAQSQGGTGGTGNLRPGAYSDENLTGGTGGTGGSGGSASLSANIQALSVSGAADGLLVQSLGGAGGNYPTSNPVGPEIIGGNNVVGGLGGAGGTGGDVSAVLALPDVTVSQASGQVVHAGSYGGAGGRGSDATFGELYHGDTGKATGGGGGVGGAADNVTVTGSVQISGTTAPGFVGVLAESVGGAGGTGGDAYNADNNSKGGNGGAGGAGGTVNVGTTQQSFRLVANLRGDQSSALITRSYGGAGGDGGTCSNSYGSPGLGGGAAGGGAAKNVNAYLNASVTTAGTSSDALLVQSVGGFAGSGLAAAYGAGTQSYGTGGDVNVVATLTGVDGLNTTGNFSDAIAIQSIGGGGGTALQDLGLTTLGGANLAGGKAGTVAAQISGSPIDTSGSFSRGIFAQSIGGGGGSGGGNGTITSVGAPGGLGGDAGSVSVTTSSAITTTGNASDALVATSIGGGGGSAQTAAGVFSIGGQNGGGGGDGGQVNINFTNAMTTSGTDAAGVFAQSIGGGGGDGANVVAAGVGYTLAVGGNGAIGGKGGAVTIGQLTSAQGAITTKGDRSVGVEAQSIGGGGGDGGGAIVAGVANAFSHAVGGNGGKGGTGGDVSLSLLAPVSTAGALSDAVFAQSIGGGGGSARTVVNADFGGGVDVNLTQGGSGGSGGAAGNVGVSTQQAISTGGMFSSAIVAESLGGGGGHSGLVVSNTTGSMASIGITIGGNGGGGGNAGAVNVTANGAVATQGAMSDGIIAHSVGGGGGNGGMTINTGTANFGDVTVGIGAKGGTGGDGGDVVVATGSVTTEGDFSKGISAKSTGGSGGSGGAVVDANAITTGDINVTLGGNGGIGGNAGKVSVTTTGDVQTHGDMADAIYATSLGGGGGDAGIKLGSAATGNTITAGSINITLGGDGGAGGKAGSVNVNSQGNIGTSGLFSSGIFAQSLGGGGGSAYGTMTANAGDIGNATVNIGGNGGQGGVAGDVTVSTMSTSDAVPIISVLGPFSKGILAQSIGGVGGSGGFAAEASFNVGAEATGGVSGQLGVTVGGGGATGGLAGLVNVTNNDSITTDDFASDGIFAQSVGGNGGNGGKVFSGNLDANTGTSVNINVNVGGDAGYGAQGNNTTVTNYGDIATTGYMSSDILAQAIGGNGGNGGSTYAVLTQVGPGSPINATVSVGGEGGGGGESGAVSVTNGGTLTTARGGSDAIIAQSIGGGGGRGGSAGYIGVDLTPPVDYGGTPAKFQMSVNVGDGGKAGAGGEAGAVTVNNNGDITTSGTRSRGIFAQSIGGGGGDGGTASATSFALSDPCNIASGKILCPKSNPDAPTTVSISSTVQIGGYGGMGADGNTVTIDNAGNITTSGQLSHGIYAQSIGGGGGVGGEGALGIEAWTTNNIGNTMADLPSNFFPSFSSVDVAVGGKGAGGGNGSAVSVNNSGTIQIQGPDPSYLSMYTGLVGGFASQDQSFALPFLSGGMGIFAQSVGGGGGDGGAGSSGLTATVTVGNTGGGGGDGGDVTVTNTGSITNTSGFNGIGIFAQSVGGGGGVAGDVGLGFSDKWLDLNIGAGVAVVANSGSGGNGGDVSVTSSGAILTTGVDSDGIVAQSVGGSGGIAAMSSTNPVGSPVKYIGSAGGYGNGGNVNVTANAPISVSGQGSVGIAAFSASGLSDTDQSGAVTVTANANITASGEGGRGILAGSDSTKITNTGLITINVGQGVNVSTTSTQGAETIGVLGGGVSHTKDNKVIYPSINNQGTIRNANPDSYAIRVESGSQFDISNSGVIDGSILTKAENGTGGAFVYSGVSGSALNAGSTILLDGVGSVFDSAGTLSPGGVGHLQNTTIQASIIAVSGAYQTDFDPSQVEGGTLVAGDKIVLYSPSGNPALLSGITVTPNLVVSNPNAVQRSGNVDILQTAGPLSATDFSVANTATANYGLSVATVPNTSTNELLLSYNLSTTPWEGRALSSTEVAAYNQLNDNQKAFGQYLDRLIFGSAANSSSPFMTTLAATVFILPDANTLLDAYSGFVPEEALAVSDATYLSTLQFSNSLYGCGRQDGSSTQVVDSAGNCTWGGGYGRGLTTHQSTAGPSYTEHAYGFTLGREFALDPATKIALSGAIEHGNLDIEASSADVNRVFGGVMLSRTFGAFTMAGSVEAGTFGAHLNRVIASNLPVATSDQHGYYAATHLRFSKLVPMGDNFIEPMMDLGLTRLHQGAFSEGDIGDFGMAVSALQQTTFSLNPTVTLGHDLSFNKMAGQVSVRAGMLALAGKDPSVEASFIGAGSGIPGFQIQNSPSRVLADFGVGLNLAVSEHWLVKGSVDTLQSGSQKSWSASLMAHYRF